MTIQEFTEAARGLVRPGLAFRTLPSSYPHRRTLRRYPEMTLVCVRLDGTPEDLAEGAARASADLDPMP